MGEGLIAFSLLIDEDGGFLYVGLLTTTAPNKIKKIRLSDFTLVDTLSLNAGDQRLSKHQQI